MIDRTCIGLAALALAAASTATAQTPEAPASAVAAPADQGVITYPPTFFADQRPNTALDMVQRLPGFSFDAGDAVRGLAGGGGNVLIDGQRSLSKAEALDEVLRRIPAASVERIEIIRGGAPGIDMQGRTLVANVVRRVGGGLAGATQISGGYLWDDRRILGLRAELQWRGRDQSLEGSIARSTSIDDGLASGVRLRRDGTGAVIARSNVEAFGDGPRRAAAVAYEGPLWGGRLRLNSVLQDNLFKGTIIDRFTTGEVEREFDFIQDRHAEFGGRYTRPLIAGLTFEAVGLQRFNRELTYVDFTSPGADRTFDLRRRSGESVGPVELAWIRSPTLSLRGGGEGAFNWLEGRTRLTDNGVDIPLPAANVRVDETRGELFGEATWRPRTGLSVEAGLRLEASTISAGGDTELSKTLFYPKPRLVVTWSPSPTRQVRFRLEREVGQLNFGDFVAASSVANTGRPIAGNPDIVPQQSWVAEAAFEQRFWGDGVASLTLRRAWINDVVDSIPLDLGGGVIIDAPGNLGDGSVDTAIAAVSLPLARLGLAGAQLRSAVTWRSSEVTDPVTGRPRPVSGLHGMDWEVHFTQDLPTWRMNWGVDVYSGYSETTYRVSEISNFSLRPFVSLFGEYKPRPNLLLRLEVHNVTGRDTDFSRIVYDGPRNTGQVALAETRQTHPGPYVLFRVRQTI